MKIWNKIVDCEVSAVAATLKNLRQLDGVAMACSRTRIRFLMMNLPLASCQTGSKFIFLVVQHFNMTSVLQDVLRYYLIESRQLWEIEYAFSMTEMIAIERFIRLNICHILEMLLAKIFCIKVFVFSRP